MICYAIWIEGKVQGVWFRASAKEEAYKNNILGIVQNNKDGSVYIEAVGADTDMAAFLKWCERGPTNARVDNITFKEIELKSFDEFRILRT